MPSVSVTRLLTVLLVFASALYGCGYRGEIKTETEDLENIANKFQPLIQAFESYKNDHGKYPSDINSLNPKYTKGLLVADGWKQYAGIRFGYHNPSKTSHNAEAAGSWGGYEIAIYDIRKFQFMFPKAIQIFVYRSSQYYPDRRYETPIKRVGGWALIDRRRPLRDENPYLNPVEGPGV